MNNYDDIKRFKEKLNMENVDYKEIAESNPNITSHNWAILSQVATADEPFHPLDHGHSTQPTPIPVSQQEFTASAQAAPIPPRPLPRSNQDIGSTASVAGTESGFASPLMKAVSQALPPAPAAKTPPNQSEIASGTASPADIFGSRPAESGPLPSTGLAGLLNDPPPTPPDISPAQRQPNTGASIFGAPARQAQPIAQPPIWSQAQPPEWAQPQEPAQSQPQRPAQPQAPLWSQAQPQRPAQSQAPIWSQAQPQRPTQPQSPAASQQQAPLWSQAQPHRQAPVGSQAQPQRPAQPLAPMGSQPQQKVSAQDMRFKSLFNRHPQQANTGLAGQDMPLSLLLENIALCR